MFAEITLRRSRTILSSRGKNGSSALPQCLRRACFATARQRRGCGSGVAPSSATGSGLRLIQEKRPEEVSSGLHVQVGESKGNTRVAARAVRRGLEPRIPLTLNRTSDRDSPPLLHAARGNKNSKKPRPREPVADVTGVVYALRVQSVSSWAAEGVRPYKCRQHCGRWRDPP